MRKPTGLFVFPATPLGAAAHREVQLFNNSDAKDRAAVKQRRERVVVCSRVAPAARRGRDTSATNALRIRCCVPRFMRAWPRGRWRLPSKQTAYSPRRFESCSPLHSSAHHAACRHGSGAVHHTRKVGVRLNGHRTFARVGEWSNPPGRNPGSAYAVAHVRIEASGTTVYRVRGCSSVGRAPALQAGGRRVGADHLHQSLDPEREGQRTRLLIAKVTVRARVGPPLRTPVFPPLLNAVLV